MSYYRFRDPCYEPPPPRRRRPLLLHLVMLPAYLILWGSVIAIGVGAIAVCWLLFIGLILALLGAIGAPV